MATILSYAPAERRMLRLRRYVGPVAIVVATCGSALVVVATFQTRYALASYVGGGWCGTGRASLELELYVLPAVLFLPTVLAAGVADHWKYCAPAARISIWVAILGWATCAFVS